MINFKNYIVIIIELINEFLISKIKNSKINYLIFVICSTFITMLIFSSIKSFLYGLITFVLIVVIPSKLFHKKVKSKNPFLIDMSFILFYSIFLLTFNVLLVYEFKSESFYDSLTLNERNFKDNKLIINYNGSNKMINQKSCKVGDKIIITKGEIMFSGFLDGDTLFSGYCNGEFEKNAKREIPNLGIKNEN